MYDLIIIGTGPAGLTASIFASCYKLNHICVGQTIGGQLGLATNILNYPGFASIKGKELVDNMVSQTKSLGAQVLNDEVIAIEKITDGFTIKIKNEARNLSGKAVILATGAERRKLNVPGEVEYTGRGVFYCATCEPTLYTGKKVVITGGGNSAFAAAAQVVEKAMEVTILVRSQVVRAEDIWFEKVKNNPKVKIITNAKVLQISGDNSWLKKLSLEINTQKTELEADILFVEIGSVPGTALAVPLGVKFNPQGYIQVDHKLATSVEGIFAAGDIVGDELSIEQLSTAVGLGARAAASCYYFLKHDQPPTVWGKSQIRRKI